MEIYNKKLKFPEETKAKLESVVGTKNTEITYINGNLISFKGTNMDCINPNKAIVKKGEKEIILLFYGQYYEDPDAFFIYNINHKCSWNKLKEILT